MTELEHSKEECLIKCHRYCVLCEEYKGTKIECHHIVHKKNGGDDTSDNLIPVCFDCHSEIGNYNADHPRGTKFKPSELKKRRDIFYQRIADSAKLTPPDYADSIRVILKENKFWLAEIIREDPVDGIRPSFFYLTSQFEDGLLGKMKSEVYHLSKAERIYEHFYERFIDLCNTIVEYSNYLVKKAEPRYKLPIKKKSTPYCYTIPHEGTLRSDVEEKSLEYRRRIFMLYMELCDEKLIEED